MKKLWKERDKYRNVDSYIIDNVCILIVRFFIWFSLLAAIVVYCPRYVKELKDGTLNGWICLHYPLFAVFITSTVIFDCYRHKFDQKRWLDIAIHCLLIQITIFPHSRGIWISHF